VFEKSEPQLTNFMIFRH